LRITHSRQISVHESNGDTVVVEEGSSKSDTLQDKAQVLDATAFLLKLHGATVIDIQDNIVKSELDNIIGYFLGNTPALNNLIDLSGCLLRDLIEHGGI